MFEAADISAFFLTIRLALTATLILLLIGMPVAWWLAKSQWRFKYMLEAIIALPLVLPPTVLGFYLLLLLGANGPFAAITGTTLAFSFTGLVIGSVIYSLPFVIQPLQDTFQAIGTRPMEVAATLRASPRDKFLTVALPLARPGFITASVLGFAHTLGEFGVVLMIGGNIPGQTRVLSIAIFDHVESLDYGSAHLLAGSLLVLSFIMLTAVYATNKRFRVFRL
jgi:molybdate transport system permease protein